MRDIFTPVILVCDRNDDKKHMLESYNELFHKEGVKQKRVMLLGEAGAGKTTFCQHLVDVWCNPSSKSQFSDVEIIKQYQFLFYVCCRSADKYKNQSVLEMIKSQLFSNDELRNIACNVLNHNADSCMVLMDGFDELQRSVYAKTYQDGDITGFPSFSGIQNCVLFVTSRTWKFFSIPYKYEREKFSCMQLDGIKDIKQLVKTIFQKHRVENPAKSCTDFLDSIEERELSELMKFPIMLLFALDVWLENGSLPKSVCLCYINMICLAVCRSARKREEANVESKSKAVDKLLNKYLESAEYLPNPLSNFECLQQNAGLLLHLAQLAYDLLLLQYGQTLVFQMDDCKKYSIHKRDGSLEYCLDLGLLMKIESTVKGIKQREKFQFCHKTYQEFFAALWLSYRYIKEGSQAMSCMQSCIKSKTDLNKHNLLIQFLCGLCPDAGADLWKYVAQNDKIEIDFWNRDVQDQILKTVKEVRDCCYHQGDQVFYCIRVVDINKYTTDEDVSLLCKMIQNNSCYLKHLRVWHTCLSSSQYHSLFRSASSAIELEKVWLYNISCQSNDSNEDLPVLDMSNHCRLEELILDEISISGLVVPSQEGSRLRQLYLNNLVLPHDHLVNICSSLSTVTEIWNLRLISVSCRTHQDYCCLPVLDIHSHCELQVLILDKIPISGLVVPSQEESQLIRLYLYNLVLRCVQLVNLCSSLSSVTEIERLSLTRLSCRWHEDGCSLPVLDLRNHCRLQWLKLDNIAISGLVLPSQEETHLSTLYLDNLVLPHYNLVGLCSAVSSLSSIDALLLIHVRCNDHDGSRDVPTLNLPKRESDNVEKEQMPDIEVLSLSGLDELKLPIMPYREQSGACRFTVLDLQQHRKLRVLKLDASSVSCILLPRYLNGLVLSDLVLSHYSLEQLPRSLSFLSDDYRRHLVNLSCSDHGGSCELPSLYHRDNELKNMDIDDMYFKFVLTSAV